MPSHRPYDFRPSFNLRHDSKVPLYHQLKEEIKRMILSGRLRDGDLLPSEREFKARYKISTTTIRYALSDLVHENLLERKAGKGTFVRLSDHRHLRQGILGFDANMRAMGVSPSTAVVGQALIPAKGREGEKLGLDKEKALLKLIRLRMGNHEPVMLETRFIRTSLFPGIEKRMLSNSLWQIFRDEYGIKPFRQSQHVRIEYVFGDEASLLGLKDGFPCAMIEGATYLKNGQPIEWGEFLYRSDRYELAFEAGVE